MNCCYWLELGELRRRRLMMNAVEIRCPYNRFTWNSFWMGLGTVSNARPGDSARRLQLCRPFKGIWFLIGDGVCLLAFMLTPRLMNGVPCYHRNSSITWGWAEQSQTSWWWLSIVVRDHQEIHCRCCCSVLLLHIIHGWYEEKNEWEETTTYHTWAV